MPDKLFIRTLGIDLLKDIHHINAYDKVRSKETEVEFWTRRIKKSIKGSRNTITLFEWGATLQGFGFWSKYCYFGNDEGRSLLQSALLDLEKLGRDLSSVPVEEFM